MTAEQAYKAQLNIYNYCLLTLEVVLCSRFTPRVFWIQSFKVGKAKPLRGYLRYKVDKECQREVSLSKSEVWILLLGIIKQFLKVLLTKLLAYYIFNYRVPDPISMFGDLFLYGFWRGEKCLPLKRICQVPTFPMSTFMS